MEKNNNAIWRRVLDIVPKNMRIPLIITLVWNGIAYFGTRIFTSGWYHHDLSNDLDNMIPFWPWTITIYWVCYLYWGINYIWGCRQDEEEAYRFISAEFLAKTICMLFFLIYPTTNSRPEIEGSGIFVNLMRALYTVDDADNLFPSIHCLVSWFCVIGVRHNDEVPRWYKIFSYVFTAAICISTLTTKQHVLLDVVGGIGFAELSYYLVKWIKFDQLYAKVMKHFVRHSKKKNRKGIKRL